MNTTEKLTLLASNCLGDSNIEVFKNNIIFEADEMPLGLLYIKKGVVKLICTDRTGKVSITYENKGSFLGLDEVLQDRNYKSSAIAETTTELLFLSRREIKEAIQ